MSAGEARAIYSLAYGAVGEGDGTSKLDEVSSADRVERKEVEEVVDTVGDTVVGREERFNSREEEHRAVGSSATVEYVRCGTKH